MRKRLVAILLFLLSLSSFASGIDAKFKYRRINKKLANSVSGKSYGVHFYQKVLSNSLATDCIYYPSDSAKAQLDFKRCSSSYAILSAMERFIREPDESLLNNKVIQIGHKNYYFDLPTHCDFF